MEALRPFYESPPSLVMGVTLLLYHVELSSPLEFNRNFTGVAFLPFVLSKNVDGNHYHPEDKKMYNYSGSFSSVMLRVVATKFSHILTYGMGGSPPHIYNITYYKDLTMEGYTAEAAARVNKEMGYKALSILQGVWGNDDTSGKNELLHALEATEKAHHIFPDTVDGIVFANYVKYYNNDDARRATRFLRMVKNSTFPQLLVGALWNCEKLLGDLDRNQEDLVTLLKESSLIICNHDNQLSGGFEALTKKVLIARERCLKVNAGLRVMARIMWKSERSRTLEDLQGFRSYWEAVNIWAANNSFPVYLDEAIENPRMPGGHGWWNLSDNAKRGQIDGYVEQVPDPATTIPWMTILKISGIVLCAVVSIVGGGYSVFKLIMLMRKCCLSSQMFELVVVISEFENGLVEQMQSKGNKKIPSFEAIKAPYDKSLEIATDKITMGNKGSLQIAPSYCLHEGEVTLLGESKPVWLRITDINSRLDDIREMLDEIKILTYLGDHPNIVKLIGVCSAQLGLRELKTVLEPCSAGPLSKYLRRDSKPSLQKVLNGNPQNQTHSCPVRGITNEDEQVISSHQMLLWSYEIATGMEYLSKKRIIHGSLGACKILLSSKMVSKISGFNLSRQIRECEDCVKRGTCPSMWRWLSIECLTNCKFSTRSDAWSFGVTLWEIFSKGETPYAELQWTDGFVTKLENGLRLLHPRYATPKIYNVLRECWNMKPTSRPNFTTLKELLNPYLNAQKYESIAEVEIL